MTKSTTTDFYGDPETVTLAEARAWLREVVHEGAICPCCTQLAKVYRRKLNAGMAVSLIRMWRAAGYGWLHIPTSIPARSREEGKLRYWGLAEEAGEKREDGGRAGWWRVTEEGAIFVNGESRVPKYALVYDDRCLGLRGDPVSIVECLGSKFDYHELMEG